ncbi:adenosine deaminase [Paenibacillus sp. N4]|uniref:adenosine deaminase n=1 Tax=Paenibacillus vietnamensis TaxID=2590547 RepID=UPI001CD06D6D|nr:adenosine deaminase [Paenibacillus vietnamensis]MCA0754173.1 adenosine deaminase [Paenibacillus vietnamensis]
MTFSLDAAERSLLERLPKIELHVHLDGSVRPQTLKELALEAGRPLTAYSDAELESRMKVNDSCGSLTEYLEKFSFVLPYLQTGEALERTAYELVEQAAAGRVRYIEVRFAPQLHRVTGLTLEAVIRHVTEGLKRGEQHFGTVARAIVICLRSHPLEQNMAVIEEAARFHGKGVVAADLAGDEASYPPGLFRGLFGEARRLGLPVTIHAGEAGGADHVRVAVMELGASRIGHGVRIMEDASVMELVKEKQIPLEMCPVSNLQTKAVSAVADYPLRRYLENGILVTVNTDNMTVSDTTLQKEYELLLEHCGLSIGQLVQVIMNGARASFLEPDEKARLIEKVTLELAVLGLTANAGG